MSFKPMIWAWEVDGLTQSTKLVLMSLANHANDRGTSCHPSIDRIASEACMSVRSVQYALKWLAEKGYIQIYPRTRDTHQFRLMMDLKVEARRVQNLHQGDNARVQDTTARVQDTAFDGANSAPEPRIEPRKEPRTLFGGGLDEEASGEVIPKITADALIEIWNRHCSHVKKVARPSAGTKQVVLLRFKSEFESDLAQWERFCKRAANAPWLAGVNPTGWRLPNIEWLLRPAKLDALWANSYGGEAPRQQAPSKAPYAGYNPHLRPGDPDWRPSPGTI